MGYVTRICLHGELGAQLFSFVTPCSDGLLLCFFVFNFNVVKFTFFANIKGTNES